MVFPIRTTNAGTICAAASTALESATYKQCTHALFEDFLEAICRVVDLKVLPDPSEVGKPILDWYNSTELGDRRTYSALFVA